MDAEPILKTYNPAALALASLMKFDQTQKVRLTGEFFIRLAEIPISREDQELVAGFFLNYQHLSRAEALQMEREMSKIAPDMAREKVIQWSNPFIELGIERGLRQGRRQGRQEGRKAEIELVLRQLRRRLGSLTAAEKEAVRKLTLRNIEAIAEALLDFRSSADLDQWLLAHSK
jgi:flagellar biosynthesis/type III secretory pathway protein FliH